MRMEEGKGGPVGFLSAKLRGKHTWERTETRDCSRCSIAQPCPPPPLLGIYYINKSINKNKHNHHRYYITEHTWERTETRDCSRCSMTVRAS